MILLTTLLPTSSMPQSLSIWDLLSFDSFAHGFMFAILTFLMIVGMSKQYTYTKLRHYAIRVSLATCFLFGVTIELIQHISQAGRHGDIMDVLSNTIGCFLGILLFKIIYKR
ncbi:VanZ family protein [Pontibacter vulgaris]|uniref:VanZ family protein n=1 Tax=Pontibacter vulgaris TaxID=2905679 RepID=UPI001FA7EC35|nr:VanZ family protein [Pontibacter vulgaris]